MAAPISRCLPERIGNIVLVGTNYASGRGRKKNNQTNTLAM